MRYQPGLDMAAGSTRNGLLADLLQSKQESVRPLLDKTWEGNERDEFELQAAREAQSWMFPRNCPVVRGLSYAGVCRQAGHVGGDFYDFIDNGEDQLGIVVGDVAGKGMAAALLMANLRALVRSQFPRASAQLEATLQSVNRMFFESTPAAMYATLFVAHYDARIRRLQYVNCGHPAALVRHADGRTTRLVSTAEAVGLFSEWKGAMQEIQLQAGDTLLVYTDGITESVFESGEEFGEEGLFRAVDRMGHAPVDDLVKQILASTSPLVREAGDDMTLVGVRVTEG